MEYALKKVYNKIKDKEENQKFYFVKKRAKFKKIMKIITTIKRCLHEAIGENLLKLLFDYELKNLIVKLMKKSI